MTKSELKGIIMECIDEIQLESVDEDQAIIEQEEVVAEACYNMLMESVSGFSDPDDPDYIDRSAEAIKCANAIKRKAEELKNKKEEMLLPAIGDTTDLVVAKTKAAEKVVEVLNSPSSDGESGKSSKGLGKWFKLAGEKIVVTYTGDKKVRNILITAAAAATAIAGVVAAIAVKKNKKKKDEQNKENNNEDKKENNEEQKKD